MSQLVYGFHIQNNKQCQSQSQSLSPTPAPAPCIDPHLPGTTSPPHPDSASDPVPGDKPPPSPSYAAVVDSGVDEASRLRGARAGHSFRLYTGFVIDLHVAWRVV